MPYTTIKKPSDYFNTKLYTGTGAENAITSVGFQPNLTWIKDRTTAYSHQLVDSVRGATKNIFSDIANAEATDAQSLKSFDTDGFTVGTRLGMNTSGNSYVSWNWLASNTTTSNTDGSTSSTVSVNTTSGFSIVKYTGPGGASTIGHGLGSAPKLVIVKNITAPYNLGWRVYHYSAGATKTLYLNENNGATTDSAVWNNTAPTSTVFSIGSASEVSADYTDFIAYCFTEVKGFSKFGKIQGNGNADGPFCYLGFSPAFLLYKKLNGLGDWYFVDNRRPGYNDNNKRLYANTDQAEETYNMINLYSNGFKLTTSTHPYINDGAGEYSYIAFAEEPLVGDNPATAR